MVAQSSYFWKFLHQRVKTITVIHKTIAPQDPQSKVPVTEVMIQFLILKMFSFFLAESKLNFSLKKKKEITSTKNKNSCYVCH